MHNDSKSTISKLTSPNSNIEKLIAYFTKFTQLFNISKLTLPNFNIQKIKSPNGMFYSSHLLTQFQYLKTQLTQLNCLTFWTESMISEQCAVVVSLVNIDSMLKFCFASVTHVLGSQQRERDLAFKKPSTLLVLSIDNII